MNTDQQRAAFEARFPIPPNVKYSDGHYRDVNGNIMTAFMYEFAWEAWQAAVKWASETEEGAEALGFLKGLESGTRAALASPEVRAMREALWVCAEHNALHFGELHNTVIQARSALTAMEKQK